jgi:hypothetical protein
MLLGRRELRVKEILDLLWEIKQAKDGEISKAENGNRKIKRRWDV